MAVRQWRQCSFQIIFAENVERDILFCASTCTQGPSGAFSALNGLTLGTEEYARAVHRCWSPLFVAMRRRLAGDDQSLCKRETGPTHL